MSKNYNVDKQEPDPEALRKFLDLCSDDLISRDEINKKIYSYVIDRKLCDEAYKHIIHPDKTLQKLFKLQEGETLDLNSLQYLSIYYPLSISNVNNEKKTVKFAEDVKENCNSKDDDKGWSDLEDSEEESEEESEEDAEESDNEEEGWTDLEESDEESEEETKKEIKKDYSILSNLFEDKTNEIDEKEIEEKYSEFLEWLKKDWMSKNEYYTIISEKYHKCIPNNYIDLKCDIDNKLLKYLKKRYFEIRGCRGQYCCNKSCSLNIHIDINPIIINKITNLEKTNKDILKKLEEQIQLNNKLCERIFEMKEEKFKNDKT